MYNNQEKIIMWLSSFDFMTYKKAKFIIDNIDDLNEFFDNISNYYGTLNKVFSREEISELKGENKLNYIESVINNYEKLNIQVVTIISDDYPELLRQTEAPPIMLYCKGNIKLLKSECIGVVGTRRATRYGKDVGSKIIKDIATENITIVSGLADGIDTTAHASCLEVGGNTIAVLGSGLLNIYPATNVQLAKAIIDHNGLIVSEYKPSEPAVTFHFPIRNRIIAGLSRAVLIVEATEKSGSMHTKNYALDYGREVFAMPARISDIYSQGCNKLIQNGHARMLLNASEIIDFFGGRSKSQGQTKVLQLTTDEQIIYDMLLGHELHFDDLLKGTGMQTKTLLTMLMRMEINKIITKLPGNYYTTIN